MTLATYLSEYVHRILVEYSGTPVCSTEHYVFKDLVYDWKKIGDALGNTTDDFDIMDQADVWYMKKSQQVWQVIHEAGLAESAATDRERQTLYQLCGWVDCQTDVFDYANHCEHRDEDGPLLAVLVLTAALEQALGNVYMTKSYPVPFLLRDLLKTPELTSIFGEVPILFTQLLMGCPRGFNLRNVAWHGFVSAGELHPHLVSGLIVLIASLGKILSGYQMIPKRPLFKSHDHFQEELNGVFPDISSRCEEVELMVKESTFIQERGKVLWRKAFNLLQLERCGYSLVLLIPQLEHCLRVIYCRVNDCPVKLLTAESIAYYTTLDEILAPAQNPVVDSGLLKLLLDLTDSFSGPRLRDRLSHGEIDLNSVPKWLVNVLFCVALAAAHTSCGDQKDDNPKCAIPLCSLLKEVTSRYRSRFHVLATLSRQLASLLDQWPGWHHCSLPSDVAVQSVSCESIHAFDQLMFSNENDIARKLCIIKECLEKSELPTLYRPKLELELAAALGVVVSRVEQTAEQVCRAAASRHQLWRDRQLRSRARATALRMWAILPDVWTALLCTVMVVTLCCRHIPQLATLGKSVFRFVKILKKAVENTVKLCSSENNRWMEAHQILSNLASECLKFFRDNTELVKSIEIN